MKQWDGLGNRHNVWYWIDHNPRGIDEAHPQNPKKLNICVGMDNTIISSVLINGILTERVSLQLLKEIITPGIRTAIENDDFDYNSVFKQNEAPTQFYVL